MGNLEYLTTKTLVNVGRDHKKLKGFTLAEVLIVLTIIGIVASLTIPALINNVDQQQYVTKLRKECSVLMQAYQSIKADNGGQIEAALSGCPNGVSGEGHTCLKEVFKPKLKYIKDCYNNDGINLNVCFPQRTDIKYLNGTNIDSYSYVNNNVTSGLTLSDGASLAFYLDDKNCQKSLAGLNYNNRCGFIIVDVNGLKRPNQFGKDIYVFFIFSDMIRPASTSNTDAHPDCTTYGLACAQKYLYGN